jgi:N6-L-threonylcarbamoyladenine synthase
MKDEVILAIESSCDETAVAVLKNGQELMVNTVNTQIADHQRFVPSSWTTIRSSKSS